MDDKQRFDFWYAVENTSILVPPKKQLETFGNTYVRYNLITELMDSVDKVRVREGSIKAFRPQIITPDSFSDNVLDGFDEQSREYLDWLKENQPDLFLLKYGFSIRNREVSDHIVNDSLKNVIGQVEDRVEEESNPNTAVVVGVDNPWEVCLLKLMVEVVQSSVPGNFKDIKKERDLLSNKRSPQELERQVDEEFKLAAQNPGRIDHLGRFLEKHGIFEKYQDRFFDLVRSWRR